MNKQMTGVMQKRGELLARIAAQRGQAAEIGKRLETPLALADQGLAAMCFLRSNPAITAAVAALFVIRRRGVVGLVRGVWRVWKRYRYFTSISAKLLSHF